MNKIEYEKKISNIAGKLQDLEDTVNSLLRDVKEVIRDMEYLPELVDLIEEPEDD